MGLLFFPCSLAGVGLLLSKLSWCSVPFSDLLADGSFFGGGGVVGGWVNFLSATAVFMSF